MSIQQSNLTKEPSTLEEIYGQDRLIKRLKGYIESETYPASMFFSGPPGTGKTITARNFIKTVRCLNRPKYSATPCGNCPVCKSDPRTEGANANILWIQQGRTENVSEQVKRISDFIEQPPELMGLQGSQEHNNRKFLVVDELQALSDPLKQKLLYHSELYSKLEENRVTLILITMEKEKMKEIGRRALMGRSIWFFFSPPEKGQIISYIQKHFGEYPIESLKMIAESSENNFRMALTLMDCCQADDPSLHPVSVAQTLCFVNTEKRMKIWELVQGSNMRFRDQLKELNQYLTELIRQGVIENNLLCQMIDDIRISMIYGNENVCNEEDQLEVMEFLMDQLSSNTRVSLHTILTRLAKRRYSPVDFSVIEKENQVRSGYDLL